MAGISIPFLANVRDFLRGKSQVSRSLEEVADDLTGLARDADRAGDKLGDSIADGAREAESATDDLRRRIREALDVAQRDSRRAGDELGDNVKRGTDRAGDGLRDMKQEAGQSARESAQSFQGSFDDIGDLAQETAAQAFSGFGALGAAAGIAAAAGFGIIRTMIEEDAEAAERRVSAMFNNFAESGVNYATFEQVKENLQAIFDETDDAAISLDNLRKAAEETGLAQATVARAYAGDTSAAIELTERLAEMRADLNERMTNVGPLSRGPVADRLRQENLALEALEGQWRRTQNETDSAINLANEYRDALSQVPTTIDTEVSANVQLAQAELNRFMQQRTALRVPVTADTTALGRDIDRELSKMRTVRLRAGAPVVI